MKNLRNTAVGFRRVASSSYRRGLLHGYVIGAIVAALLGELL